MQLAFFWCALLLVAVTLLSMHRGTVISPSLYHAVVPSETGGVEDVSLQQDVLPSPLRMTDTFLIAHDPHSSGSVCD